MTETREMILDADTMDAYIALFGMNDQNIAMIEQECSVCAALRGNHLVLKGDPEHLDLANQAVSILLDMIRRNEPVDRVKIRYVINMVREGKAEQIIAMLYSHYIEHPEELTEEYRKMMEDGEPREVVICDYIAGMTDNYAVLKFREIFLPSSWQKT